MVKRCARCKKTQTADCFYKDSRHSDGLRSICKTCEREYMREYMRGYRENNRKFSLKVYKNSAQRRGYEWLLTDEQALTLFSGPCFYCGGPGGGIDRMNNKVGYVIENCASCCSVCNFMKGGLSSDEFLSHVARIAVYGIDIQTKQEYYYTTKTKGMASAIA